ncbi:hypothetical protein ACC738_38865, partial [Rhizobium ruizarguesonis]
GIAFRAADTPLGNLLINSRGASLHVADQAGVTQTMGRHGKERLRVARTIGAGGLQAVDELERGAACADRTVDLQRLVG